MEADPQVFVARALRNGEIRRGGRVVNEGDDPGPQNCVIDKTDPDGIARGDAGDTGALNAVSE
jgi:hypothetical protein